LSNRSERRGSQEEGPPCGAAFLLLLAGRAGFQARPPGHRWGSRTRVQPRRASTCARHFSTCADPPATVDFAV